MREKTHNDVTHPDATPPHSAGGLSRRRMIDLAARAGTIALALGAVSSLTGCSSAAQKRARRHGGSVGDPIPSDPVAHNAKPAPVDINGDFPGIGGDGSGLSAIPPFVVPRVKWTNEQPKRWLADPMGRVTRITVHHDAIMPVPSGSYADSLRRLQLIRTGHLNKGWADIGYHFAIDPSGRIWQARPLELQGAHVKDNNPGNLGIVIFGNYEEIRPTSASLDAVNKMIAYSMARFNVPMSRVYTHQELRPTLCPGRNLQAQMIATRASGGRLAQLVGQSIMHS